MIHHVPSSAAQPLSEALWARSCPAGVTQPGQTRHRFFGRLTRRGMDGSWCRRSITSTCMLRLHPEASLRSFPRGWGMGITREGMDALAAGVGSHRGGAMWPWDFFPPLFKALSKTHAEMIAAGLLAETQMPGP